MFIMSKEAIGEKSKHRYIYAVLVIIIGVLITQLSTHIFDGVINIISPVFTPILNLLNLGKPYVDVIVVNQRYFEASHVVYFLNIGNNTASTINFDITLPNKSVRIVNITNLSSSLVAKSSFVNSPFAHSFNYTQIGIDGLGKKDNISFDVILNMPANITISEVKVNNNYNESCISYLDQDIVPINLTQESSQWNIKFMNVGNCNIIGKFAIPFSLGSIRRGFNTTPLITDITFNGFAPDTTENIYMEFLPYGN
jgi:hypothetical protein